MNRYIITLFIAALWNTAWAKDIVIDRPAFRSSGSDMYPVKVELTKKATIKAKATNTSRATVSTVKMKLRPRFASME